jgi:hypothetical protein
VTISQLRSGLATRLATISGLRTSAYVPPDPMPPVAIVIPTGITFDSTFARGSDEYEFTILVLVGAVDDRTSQDRMDAYCDPSGTASIKAAVEGDKTLGGYAFTCRVREMRNYQQTPIGDQMYLSAEFVVQVYSQ